MATSFPAQVLPDSLTAVQPNDGEAVARSGRGLTPSAMAAARIFIVSEPALFREALHVLLEEETGFRVVGTAADCVEALPRARGIRPDIILIDLTRPLVLESQAVSELARGCPEARLILLVNSLATDELIEALKDGVHGVLMKTASSDVLFRSIRAVAAGQCWVGSDLVGDLVQGLSEMARTGCVMPPWKSFGLSSRELEIVAVLAAGCANREIARRFAISEKTVKHHLTHIVDKLGLSNRLEVALFALHNGLAMLPQPSPANAAAAVPSR